MADQSGEHAQTEHQDSHEQRALLCFSPIQRLQFKWKNSVSLPFLTQTSPRRLHSIAHSRLPPELETLALASLMLAELENDERGARIR